MHRNYVFCILASMCLIGVAGCASSSVQQGNRIEDAQVEQIVKGRTTGIEIVQWFGSPMQRSTNADGTQTMMFSGTRVQSKASLLGAYGIGESAQTTSTNKTLVVFLKDNVVQNYDYTSR